MSTAMIVRAPASRAPAIAASADAAAADHGDGVAAGDAAGVDRGAEPGHHAAAEQAGRRRPARAGSTLVHWPAATSVFSANAPMPSAGDSSVPSASVIFCLALCVVKQYHGRPRRQARHCAADRAPVEDDEVAGRDVGDAVADRLDDAGRLVAEQEREVVVDAALAVVQVGVADAAGLDLDHGLAGPGSGTTMVVSSTGAPLARAMTPVT